MTLQATLSSISDLQRTLLSRPDQSPFTNAFLQGNSYDKDFIRESDSIERRLFLFPAIGGGGADNDEPIRKDEENISEEVGLDPDLRSDEVFLRRPEIKSIQVPSPLRRRQQVEYDALSLLISAQRLNDNYQQGPRAKKHIKNLIKQTKEYQLQNREYNEKIHRLETILSTLASGSEEEEGVKEEIHRLLDRPLTTTTTAAGGTDSSLPKRVKEVQNRINKLNQQLNTEELEVLALEEMRSELISRRKAIQRQPQKELAGDSLDDTRSPPVKSKVASPPPVSTFHDIKPTPSTSSAVGARPPPALVKPSSSGGKPPPVTSARAVKAARLSRLAVKPTPTAATASATSATAKTRPKIQPQPRPTRTPTKSQPSAESETTAASSPSAQPTSTPQQATTTTPPSSDPPLSAAISSPPPPHTSSSETMESTDELERLCEKIWDIYGDTLRYYHPGLDSADLNTTISILRKSITSRGRVNSSSNSSEVGTGQAVHGSVSTVTTDTHTAETPNQSSSISSLILLNLLTNSTPPDHSIEFNTLRSIGAKWLSQIGESEGESLVTKTVYALVAKRLLRVRRNAGKALVGFG
ncbi:unnamed protein product [Sympodiomycopsis kandeliae]